MRTETWKLSATELYRQTTDMRLVQQALGQNELSTTRISTHIVEADLAAALQGLYLG